jgi:hypothetical protein
MLPPPSSRQSVTTFVAHTVHVDQWDVHSPLVLVKSAISSPRIFCTIKPCGYYVYFIEHRKSLHSTQHLLTGAAAADMMPDGSCTDNCS